MVDSATAALYLVLSGLAPGGQTDSTPGSTSLVMAARAAAEISLDGILSESGWAAAVPVSSFTQREPDEGALATERTEDALHVGARLYDSEPDSIRAQLARRDRVSNSDRFLVFLDCYHDRRTGFYFGVNAAGTLYDGTLFNDDWDSDTWDGVWDGQEPLNL